MPGLAEPQGLKPFVAAQGGNGTMGRVSTSLIFGVFVGCVGFVGLGAQTPEEVRRGASSKTPFRRPLNRLPLEKISTRRIAVPVTVQMRRVTVR